MQNKTTLYQFIIDRSGSMADCIGDTISGFNHQLQVLRELEAENPDQTYLTSITTFNSEVDHTLSLRPIKDVRDFDRSNYIPSGMTALLDAIGLTIQRVQRELGAKIEDDRASVVVVILTDGYENSSRIFSHQEIGRMINKMEDSGKWSFSFLGADIDAFSVASSLNMRAENVIAFSKSDMGAMMNDLDTSMRDYACQKSAGNIKQDYLDLLKDKDRRRK